MKHSRVRVGSHPFALLLDAPRQRLYALTVLRTLNGFDYPEGVAAHAAACTWHPHPPAATAADSVPLSVPTSFPNLDQRDLQMPVKYRLPVTSFFVAMALAILGFALCSGTAWAHGPVRQKAIEKVLIDAPPAAVWQKIGNFSALQDWHPAVAKSPADQGNTVGSVRHILLKGGGELSETLESYDAADMKYSYRAKDGGALPVTNYTSTIRVSAEGSQSAVEWRGAFYRGFPSNNPPPELNDDAALQAITGVYRSGLEHLKKLMEGH